MDSELDVLELFDSRFNVLTSTPRKGSRLGQMPMSGLRSVEKQGTSSPVPELSMSHEMDAILPNYLVLPSVSVLPAALVPGEAHNNMISILASDIDTVSAARNSSFWEKVASVALSVIKSLPVSEDAPSSSGGPSESLQQKPSVQTPAAALAMEGGEMDCDGRVRDARTHAFRKRSLENLQRQRIVSKKIGSRVPSE